jgi:hypothetical protein
MYCWQCTTVDYTPVLSTRCSPAQAPGPHTPWEVNRWMHLSSGPGLLCMLSVAEDGSQVGHRQVQLRRR